MEDYFRCLERVMQAHNFVTFALGSVAAGNLKTLDQAMSAARGKLQTPAADANWDAVASQLNAMAPAIRSVSVLQRNGRLYMLFLRVPPQVDIREERTLVESAGQWLGEVRRNGRSFNLSPEVQALAKQAVGMISADPLVGGAAALLLAVAEFGENLQAVIVDVFKSLGDQGRVDWAQSDLTVTTASGYLWVQMWAWELSTGTVTRSTGGWNDEPGRDFSPALNGPENLAGSIQSLCGG